MRLVVDKMPEHPYRCPYHKEETVIENLTGVIYGKEKPKIDTKHLCKVNERSRYCSAYDESVKECSRLVSFDDYIRERNEKCSKEMEERVHDS